MAPTCLADNIAARLRAAPLTYREVGQTAGVLPSGYRHERRSATIGSGPDVFAQAASKLLSWQVHLQAGLRVSVSSAAAEHGTVLTLGLKTGPIQMVAPCRIVYIVDDVARQGFAYGTLPGHPECGEEAFIVDHHHDGTVSFAITAFSKPATRLAKVAGPIGVVIQREITSRYFRAIVGLSFVMGPFQGVESVIAIGDERRSLQGAAEAADFAGGVEIPDLGALDEPEAPAM
jgi:uncharacterized protein (UPF0548 family)